MAAERSFEKTHEKILRGALEVFSDKGYSAATIKDISDRAGCNSVTIFRHFEDKHTLFLRVIERFCALDFDEEALQARLSYINVRADLTVIAGCFFELLLRNIHIMRIFISDGLRFEETTRYLWYLPAPFKDFVKNYLEAVYAGAIPPVDGALIAEMFVSYITRTCLRVNVHEGAEENSLQVTREAKEIMAASADTVAGLCMLHVKRAQSAGGG